LLHEMLAAFPERPELAREVLLCEQEGDRLAHDVIHQIARAPKRPALESSDVYELIHALDDIVDYAEETADSLGLYAIEAPMDQAQQLAEVLWCASVAVQHALERLRSGEELNAFLVEIHQLENDG